MDQATWGIHLQLLKASVPAEANATFRAAVAKEEIAPIDLKKNIMKPSFRWRTISKKIDDGVAGRSNNLRHKSPLHKQFGVKSPHEECLRGLVPLAPERMMNQDGPPEYSEAQSHLCLRVRLHNHSPGETGPRG